MMTIDREAPFDTELLKSEDFWLFSLNLYGKADIKDACIHLQDNHGADINLILLCCWLDHKGIELHEALFDSLLQTSTYWQNDILQPARQQRRTTNKQAALYNTMLNQELELEKQEQKALLDIINASAQEQKSTTKDNDQSLLRYGKILKLPKAVIDAFIQTKSSFAPAY
ncbi:TIGR02444 family protein [Kordiimonas aquimaris]|uniref:TIGR02444 family protein n=1 Tax=Kordiimonas aquimaris TaxID=707591 RepID=UPI0021D1871C|nr:TIGR02444 family protein [Kordiimonas aquimaris]